MSAATLRLPNWTFEEPSRFEPLWFEEVDINAWRGFVYENWKLPIYCAAVYIVFVFSLQRAMKDRKPFSLRGPLALWNFALGVFSIYGFVRLAPEFMNVLSSGDSWLSGIHTSLCVRDGHNKPAAFVGLLFVLSKYFELGDTLFIVLRKQPLIFLQWYHHATSMILAWQVFPYYEPITRWYILMNYGVHAIMYPYFALKAMKVKIPRKISMCITTIQLAQMLVGVIINLYTVVIPGMGQSCARDPGSARWVAVIYGSFLLMFGEFLYTSYFIAKKTKSS